MSNILSVTTFLPLVGALLIGTLNAEAVRNARWIALWTTLITFFVSLLIWWNFDTTTAGFQFVVVTASAISLNKLAISVEMRSRDLSTEQRRR